MAGNGPSPFGSVPGFDDGGSTAAVAPAPPPVIEQPITNPESLMEMGNRFLGQHKAEMAARTKEVDNVFSKQALNIENMTKMLDDTTASLRQAKEGRSNLPLMALGAGMLGSPGDFGTQLGAGLKQMVPAIQKQRGDDEDTQFKLMQMQMRRTGIENAPLEQKLAYMRALQTGDEAGIRAVEAAMLKASGQTAKAGEKAEIAANALEEKAHKDAMAAALAQIKQFGEGHYTTPEARQEAFLSAYEQAARGFKLPEPLIKQYVEAQRKIYGASQPKGGFTVPGMEEKDTKQARDLGLPQRPVGYIYDAYQNPQDRLKQFQTEQTDWQKDTKGWDEAQNKAMGQLTTYNEMERLITKAAAAQGPVVGIPRGQQTWYNPATWNTSPDAQKLNSLFNRAQTVDIPQGQGAISNFERELFASAAPNMGNLPEVNRGLIKIQRDILNDQMERRAFAQTYFSHYKTSQGLATAWDRYIQSGEGAAAVRNSEGQLVPNPNRVSWRDYFRKEGTDAQAAQPAHARGGQHNAGAIYLGDEWSD